MARLEYFIVCESASVDTATNRVSLFNVLEDIFPQQIPDELRRIDAVGLWHLDPADSGADFQAILKVTPPDLPGVDFPMNLSRGRMKYRAVITVFNIPLIAPGQLVFEMLLNGRHQASHTVTIHDRGAVVLGEDLRRSDRIQQSQSTPPSEP